MAYRIGFIGTGATPDNPTKEGFAMAYRHADGYSRLDGCELTACADIVRENAEQFAEVYDVTGVYEDYETMLHSEDLDIVSVCVPPDVHADIVVGCADHSGLEAIHCEKPMATAWKDCREMGEACERAGIKLTFNHQRRTAPLYRRAKTLVDEGKIGELRRIEWSAKNLFDAGTHMFDLSAFYTDQSPVEWVMASLDYRDVNLHFGVHNENQAVAKWKYADGTYGLAMTGRSSDAVGARVRMIGADGTIEIGSETGPPLRFQNGRTLGWKTVDVGEDKWGGRAYVTYPGYLRWGAELAAERLARIVPWWSDDAFRHPSHIDHAIESVVEAVREDRQSELTWHNAIESTEVIFAAWESVRRRARIDLPLEIEDNPLTSMVEGEELLVARGGA